ncbi:MAG TPA: FtsX-like permease family protein [Anaerolineales bacterium]|nr:FtsX-like permease family protein [Anaerolineales bacterium]
MFTAFARKARADTLGRWFHSSLIFLVISAATATVTLTLTIYLGVNQSFDRLFETAHGAHVWFTANDPVPLDPLRSLDEVTESNEPFPTLWGDLTLRRGDTADPLTLWGLRSEPLAVGKPVVVAGRWLAPGGVDEIVLDAGFGRARGIQPGEKIEIIYRQDSHILTVVGLAVNAGRAAFPVSRPGVGYVLPETLERVEPDRTRWAWILGVRIIAPDSAERFIANARAAYPPQAAISATPWQWVRDEVNLRPSWNLLFLGVFSVFALVSAGLVIVNLVGGYVSSQVREIGMLKAIGFTPGQVTALFILEYVSLGLIAAVVGGLVGLAASPPFLAEVTRVLGVTPTLEGAPVWLTYILAGISILLLCLTFLPARWGGGLSTVQAFAARVNPAASQPSFAARLALRLGLPSSIVLGVKDLFSQPRRAMFTFVSLLVAVVTVIFTVSLDSTLRTAEEDPTVVGLSPYVVQALRTDAVTQIERISHAEAVQLLDDRSEISAYLTLKTVPLQPLSQPGQAVELPGFVSYAMGGDYQQFRWYVVEGRMFSALGEAVITGELADQLGVRVGDEITLRVMQPGDGFFTDTGKRFTVRIVGRYVAIQDGGRRLLYSLDTYRQQVDASAEPDRYGLKLAPGISADSFAVELRRISGDRLGVDVQRLSDGGAGIVRLTLLGLTASLLMIAVVNLLTTLQFAVRERYRDFGILKTLGLTPVQIVTSVITNGSLLGLIAFIVGTPLGLIVTRVLFDVLGERLHLGRGILALPNPLWLVALLPFTLLLALLGSALPARHAAQVKVVEVLHQE